MPPTGEREGARERLREALDGFIAVHVEDGVCGPESSAKAEGGPEWCGWCKDAREALALDATSPAAYCAPCGRALTEEEVMCVDCASDAAPAQPGEGAMDVIRGLLAIIDEWRDESEGRRPPPSASCFECTSGTVPNHLNKGPCVEHRARALLERSGGKGLSEKGGGA